MIDARVDVEFGEPLIDMIGPALAPLLDQLSLVPLAHLRAEPILSDFAHGEHDMCVRLGQPVLADIPMYVEIGNHALVDELSLHKVAGQRNALALVHLARDCELDLARKLRVLSLLCCLDRVPEFFPVGKLRRRILGQQHFGMNNAVLVSEVVITVEPLIVQPFACAIGRRGNSTAPAGAADDFYREMEDRHDGNPSTPSKPRRHDV